jgi:Ca-activated chloride channel family protein
MSDFMFESPLQFVWLAAAFVLMVVASVTAQRRRRAMERFAESAMLQRLSPAPSSVPRFQLICRIAAVVLIACALARPVSNPHPRELLRQGRDVVFVLDVSRSMLAEDRAPNRLESAKLAISDCIDQLGGERVGLVIFAGSASIKCPLTSDYVFFLEMLERVGPDEVSHGGTLIRDALLKTTDKVLSAERRGYQDIILITDGGSHDDDPTDAVAAINQLGAKLICVGLGDDRQGMRIPVEDGTTPFVVYEEQEVLTRLEPAYLRKMSNDVKNGVYLHVATRTVDLAEVYARISASDPAYTNSAETIMVYDEHFQVALGAALVFVLLSVLVRVVQTAPTGLAAGLALSLFVSAAAAQDVEITAPEEDDDGAQMSFELPANADGRTLYNLGNAHFNDRSYEQAAYTYEAALDRLRPGKLRSRCAYNLGNAHYKIAESMAELNIAMALAEARTAYDRYRQALAEQPAYTDARVNLELCARLRLKLRKDAEQQANQQENSEESEGEEGEEEGEPSEGEEGEEESEPSEGEGEGEMESMSADVPDYRVDLENMDVPPPNVDPEQLLREQQINDEQRAANRKSGKSVEVEKDW